MFFFVNITLEKEHSSTPDHEIPESHWWTSLIVWFVNVSLTCVLSPVPLIHLYCFCRCVQLTESSVLSSACDDHQLCIVSVLPHILDCQSDCRNTYLKTLKQMGNKYKKQQWG